MVSRSRTVFRRTGTFVFGCVAAVGTSVFGVWALSSTPSLSDRLFGGAVFSTVIFATAFRAGMWPSVVVDHDKVTVRNPLSSCTIVGTARLRESDGWPQPIIEASSRDVFVFAFSSSILARLRGDRALRALGDALNSRVADNGADSVRLDWLGVVRQYAVLQLAVGLSVLSTWAIVQIR